MPMLTRSMVIRYLRSILSKGLMGLGVLWLLRGIWPLLSLVVFAGGLLIATGIGLQRLWRYQQHRYQAQIRYEDRLARQFYALLQHREGRLSVLEFAMYGRINRADARRYLYEQAQAFGAFFERTVDGDIIYIFNLGMIFGVRPAQSDSVMTPAERVWAQTVRGRAQAAPEHIQTIDVTAVNE